MQLPARHELYSGATAAPLLNQEELGAGTAQPGWKRRCRQHRFEWDLGTPPATCLCLQNLSYAAQPLDPTSTKGNNIPPSTTTGGKERLLNGKKLKRELKMPG